MFDNLFGKKKDVDEEDTNKQLIEYVSKQGVTELRTLLLGQIDRFKVDENTVIEVLKRLTHVDESTGKRFLESSDNDIKLKKAFDTVITATNTKKMSVEAIELIQKFMDMYKDLIDGYDTRNKQIYMHKLTKATELSITMVEQLSIYMNKMAVIRDN